MLALRRAQQAAMRQEGPTQTRFSPEAVCHLRFLILLQAGHFEHRNAVSTSKVKIFAAWAVEHGRISDHEQSSRSA
jgi:hypothetical protein